MTNTYQPPRTNGLGVAGFIISLVGLVFTVGFLCPIGLILSFIALFRAPRGFAFAGLVLGLVGSIVPLIFIILLSIFGVAVFSIFTMGMPWITTMNGIKHANQNIVVYQSTHAGALPPTDADGDKVISPTLDGWGQTLHFRRRASGYEIRSAGKDGVLDTPDDVAEAFTGGSFGPER